MRSRSGWLTTSSAAMVFGLLALTNISPAFGQAASAKPAAPPAAASAKPAAGAPAAGAAKPAAGAPAAGAAKPAAGAAKPGDAAAKPAKPMSDKQKKDEAKRLFKDAEAKFDKADYAGAVEAYKQADEYVPGAVPKYKIALSLDKQGQAPEAVTAWQAFLDAKPEPDKFKDKIAEADGRIAELKKTPAKVKVVTTPEAPPNLKIAVDGAPQTGKELSVPPGHHKITIMADGFTESNQEVDVNFAEAKQVDVALAAAPPPPPPPVEAPPAEPTPAPAAPPAPPPEPRSPVPAYVTLGIAGVGAVVGTIFGIQALGAKSDFNKTPSSDNADKVDRNALISDMSFAVALTFGVTGAVLLLSGDAPAEAKPAATLPKQRAAFAPFVGPTGGGAVARFAF